MATPFILLPLPTMPEKALLQQTPANRLETDLQASSIPPDLSPTSTVPALSVSIPYTYPSDSNLNMEALTQLGLTLLHEPSDSASPIGPQGPPELNQAAANNDDPGYRMRYLSGSSPPAYRPNNE